MAKTADSGENSQAAAGDGCAEQHLFRDPPQVFLCFPLIRKHKQEPGRIDYNEVKKHELHKIILSGGRLLKRIWITILTAALLTGCGAQPTFETVGDAMDQPVSAAAASILLELPNDFSEPVFGSDTSDHIYIGEDFTVMLQTVPAGDLNGTLESCTGYSRDGLTVVETEKYGLKSYACTWSAAGEGTEQICRMEILDDGSFHYVLTVMADADKAGELAQTWQELFASFRVETEPVNTAS